MISYAQNHEDVMLARAFAGRAQGFYIDVGAWHPENDSVTKHFYDTGWHGINIEPVDEYHRELTRERPRDINLRVALGARHETRVLHRVADSGLSTFSPSALADLQALGLKTEEEEIAILPLAEICDRHVTTTIDFLKIDVEGFEFEVLLGGDWQRHRPRVVLIEAVSPNPGAFLAADAPLFIEPEPAWQAWEPFLLEKAYSFAYFDGLNRFYVRHEDAALLAAFRYPPNPYDRFESATVHRLREELAATKRQLEEEISSRPTSPTPAEF